jgi:5-methylcytosine-specific restriction protein A
VNHRSGSADRRITGRRGVEQRDRIRTRANGCCEACAKDGVIRLGCEVDHIVALEDGGSNDDDNLQLLCYDCHLAKTHGPRGCTLSGDPIEGWK